jgi:hypothetical protein
MSIEIERIAELEWATYAAQAEAVRATPGIDLTMQDDAIILASIFPMPDTNHACLLRADDNTADALIDDIIQRFRWRPMPPRIFISPACSPPNLATRLEQRGFVMEEEKEAWLALDLVDFQVPPCPPEVSVSQISRRELWSFCRIFVKSFDMSTYFVPFTYLMMWPSASLANTYHYIAQIDEQPVGVCSVLCHEKVGVLGSFGALPRRRRGQVSFGLATEVVRAAQARGLETVILQTTAGKRLERFLNINGFKTLFTRYCYVLR